MEYFSRVTLFFASLLVLNCVTKTLAYTYTVTNKTGRDIKVQLYWTGGKKLNKKAQIIKKGKSYPFEYPVGSGKAGLCLTKIMVAVKQNGEWGNMKQLRKEIWSRRFWRSQSYPISWAGICKSRGFTFLWGSFPEIKGLAHRSFTGVYISGKSD